MIAHHDIDKQAEPPLVYTLRYALTGGRNPWCNPRSRGILVYIEEQHTQSEDSRFDCFNYYATLQVGVLAVTTILKLF